MANAKQLATGRNGRDFELALPVGHLQALELCFELPEQAFFLKRSYSEGPTGLAAVAFETPVAHCLAAGCAETLVLGAAELAAAVETAMRFAELT